MGRKRVQTRVPEEMAERIDEYEDDNYMNHAEAVRTLLRAGLEAETPDEPDEGEAAIDEATDEAMPNMDEMDTFGINRDARTIGGAAIVVILVVYVALQGGASAIATAGAAFTGALMGAML